MNNYTAYNGVSVPKLIYGTAWKKEKTAHLVQLAVSTGFTAIDTANQIIHYDEALVGEALQELRCRGIKRGTLFLQTKFTPVAGQGYRAPYDDSLDIANQVRQSFESSLEHLHTSYLDSYLLHGPYSQVGMGVEDWEVWAAIEEIYRSGRVKMIGISNVNSRQLRELCSKVQIKPMVVQNRCFSCLGWDRKVRKVCREHKIIYQGFSLLTANREVLSHHDVQMIAGRLGTSPAEIIFRFALAKKMLLLTGTTSQQHMQKDLRVEGLELSGDEIELIERISLG